MTKLICLMPTYNKEETLAKAIESVMMQQATFDYKLIILDDCSTDNSYNIAKEYQQKFPQKIELVRNETNLKLLQTIKNGYKRLKGADYFCVLDADDWYTYNKKFEEAVTFLEKHKNYSIYMSNIILKREDNESPWYGGKLQTLDFNFKDRKKDKSIFIQTSGVVYRNIYFLTGQNKDFDEIFNYKYPESYRADGFRFEWYLQKGKAHFENKITAVYNYNTNGLWSSLTEYEQNLHNAKMMYSCAEFIKNEKKYYLNFAKELYLSALNGFRNNASEKIFNSNSELITELAILLLKTEEFSLIKKVKNIKYKFRRLLKDLKNYLNNIKLNKIISRHKYVHIMFNDKFNKPFVDFLNRNFNPKEHIIICKRWFKEHPFPEGENVYEILNFNGLKFNNVKKIICHSLFDQELVDYLFKNPDILKEKAYWVIWGGDLYEAPRDKKNNYVRKNFKGYISDTDGDCEVAMQKYKSQPEIYNAGYTFPITKEMIHSSKKATHDYIQIQINNSADKTTLDMLDILAKYKDENIKVTTILSYGQTNFNNDIIQKGKAIFNDKFEYLDKYLPPTEYAQWLSQNDILILNQPRQQGLGNSFATLAFGSKLYIRSEITTYNHFNSKGIKVFDSNNIINIDFQEFIKYDDESKEYNMQKSLMFFDNTYLKGLWKDILGENIDTLKYWRARANRYGKYSVYNMGHSIDELENIDNYQQSIYARILNKHLSGKERVALDFGCGSGRFEPLLTKLVKEKVYAIDPTESLIKLAPKAKNIEYIHYDGNNIPIADHSIDLIFVSLVLGGITNQSQLKQDIEEMKRIASNNATFFIVENTDKKEHTPYWHYRSIEEYKELFSFCDLELNFQYEDLGEEISIFVGKNSNNVN